MDPFLISAGLSSIGHLFSGIMGFNAGNAQAKAEQVASEEALQQSGVNAQIALQQGDRTAAHGAVQAAANGGGLTGSSMGVIQDLSNQAMYNARQATYRGVTQSRNDLYDASVAKANAGNSLIGGVMGAGSSLIGGWAQSVQNQNYQKLLSEARGYGVTPQPDYGYNYGTMGA